MEGNECMRKERRKTKRQEKEEREKKKEERNKEKEGKYIVEFVITLSVSSLFFFCISLTFSSVPRGCTAMALDRVTLGEGRR